MQNNLGELLALLSFLMPNIFRSDVIETLLEFLGDGDSLPPARLAASSSSNSSPFQVTTGPGPSLNVQYATLLIVFQGCLTRGYLGFSRVYSLEN